MVRLVFKLGILFKVLYIYYLKLLYVIYYLKYYILYII